MDKTCILIVDDNPEIREIINGAAWWGRFRSI